MKSGAFMVSKKDGRQRVIFDTRNTNRHFAEPPHVSLASAEAIGDLMVTESHAPYLGHNAASVSSGCQSGTAATLACC